MTALLGTDNTVVLRLTHATVTKEQSRGSRGQEGDKRVTVGVRERRDGIEKIV